MYSSGWFICYYARTRVGDVKNYTCRPKYNRRTALTIIRYPLRHLSVQVRRWLRRSRLWRISGLTLRVLYPPQPLPPIWAMPEIMHFFPQENLPEGCRTVPVLQFFNILFICLFIFTKEASSPIAISNLFGKLGISSEKVCHNQNKIIWDEYSIGH